MIEKLNNGVCLLKMSSLTKKQKSKSYQMRVRGIASHQMGKALFFFVVDQKVKPSIQVIEGDQEGGTQRLYLQKVDEDFLPVGNPQLLLSDLTMADSDDGSPYIWSPNSQKMALLTKKKSTWKLPYPLLLSVLDVSKGTLEKIDEGRNIAANLIFSPDSQKIVFIKVGDCGKEESPVIPLKDVVGLANIEVVDLKTKERTVLPGKDFWEINGWAQGGQALVGLKQIGTKRKICEVDLSSKAITVKETPTLSIVHGAVFSHNQKYMAFLGETLFDPKEVYVANLEDLVPKKITSLSEKIDLHQIQAKPIKWTSSDRVEVEGILVYPQNYTVGHKAPLIVFIHGGPSGTALEQFIGDVWFGAYSPAVFSSVGYATLAVNYRGSSGYGTKFSTLDYQDLGGGDFQDIMAGVNFLIKEGIVDPEQLFITGHSYGGFMVSWAVGHTDRFKAAVMSAGISDWISDIALTDAPKLMESYFGSFYWDNYALYQNASPLSYVNNIKTPTLILHGAFDERVDKTQAMQLYHALNGRKVPTQLFLYSSGHGFDAIDSIDAMKEQIRWFDKYRKSPTNSGSELHL